MSRRDPVLIEALHVREARKATERARIASKSWVLNREIREDRPFVNQFKAGKSRKS